jgi:hypothetical protein
MNENFIKFIEKSKQAHGEKFDYSFVEYINIKTQVIIVCPIHGKFKQAPENHLISKHGCTECGNTICHDKRKMTKEQFLEKAKEIHGDKYDYSFVNYVNHRTHVKIVCPIHDIFEQSPNAHLTGRGCKKCGIERTKNKLMPPIEDFVKKAKIRHGNKYDYSKVEYKGAFEKVIIVCPKHKEFEQTATDHLCGCGCPICGGGATSSAEQQWIKSFNNPNIVNQHTIILPTGNKVKADGYDPSTNTVYEYHGKYWHGHPTNKHCDPDVIIRGKSAGDRYIETLMREIRLKELGYNVVSVWK